MDVKKIALLFGALVIAVVTAVMAKNMFTGAGAAAGCRRAGGPAGPEGAGGAQGASGRHDHRRRKPGLSALAQGAGPERLLHRRRRPTATSPSCSAPSSATRSPPASRSPAARWSVRTIAASSPRRSARACAPSPSPCHASSGVAGFVFPGDRVDIVLTQEVAGRRRRPAAQGFRDDRPQHPRARHRPAHRQQGRGRQDRGQDLLQRHARSHSADRREDRGRPERRAAVAVAALDRRQYRRARARRRLGRGQGAAGHQSRRRAPDAAGGRQPSDRQRTRPSPPVATCRASSAAASPPWPRSSSSVGGAQVRGAIGTGVPRRSSPVRSSASPAATMSPSFRWEHVKMTSRTHSPPRSPRHRARRAGPRPRHRRRRHPGRGPASAAPTVPSSQVLLSVGEGQMVTLPRSVADVWTSNPDRRRRPRHQSAPDQSVRQGSGEATVIATAANGTVVYRQRPRQPEHHLGRRDARWRCPKRTSRS